MKGSHQECGDGTRSMFDVDSSIIMEIGYFKVSIFRYLKYTINSFFPLLRRSMRSFVGIVIVRSNCVNGIGSISVILNDNLGRNYISCCLDMLT